ncbi:SRPBCC family protein [Vitiosangium sp. GDMCC 1.1324]|uniref:SRPBCC family protein n=1 Tax=Vitiosangium sp. (strain GDMCC 1.1324) TaxID=2138576 RepID=UPI000D35029D|nr:SRPBCC family protein [Vitiosangium sp. GDMCC 1.1324]PTL75279.1 polyketide cyclase [Vitiosangium sp. GDMCC 1.1324]
MLKKVLLALAVALVGFAAVVASRPSTFRVERSITIAAPVDLPFGIVNDFHKWHFWSPWEALDPAMKKTFDGPYAGPGAIYAWSGNAQAGEGKMTLLESQPYDSIHIQLEFIKPWPATNTVVFTFQPGPEGVTVRWAMEGHHTFMARAFSLFVDMDGMIGKDFEKGLATIKSLTETEAKNRLEREARLKAKAEAEAAQAAQAAPTAPAQATTTTP